LSSQESPHLGDRVRCKYHNSVIPRQLTMGTSTTNRMCLLSIAFDHGVCALQSSSYIRDATGTRHQRHRTNDILGPRDTRATIEALKIPKAPQAHLGSPMSLSAPETLRYRLLLRHRGHLATTLLTSDTPQAPGTPKIQRLATSGTRDVTNDTKFFQH
jgi:hypothetical protein